MPTHSVSILTYQATEGDTPPSQRYLALLYTSGAAITFFSKVSVSDARKQAEDWLEVERTRAEKDGFAAKRTTSEKPPVRTRTRPSATVATSNS